MKPAPCSTSDATAPSRSLSFATGATFASRAEALRGTLQIVQLIIEIENV
jgi:hypothetical protein